MINLRLLTCAGALTLLATAPGLAADPPQKNGHARKAEISRSAAGPVVGVGLPALVVVGGYVWYRNRTRKSKT